MNDLIDFSHPFPNVRGIPFWLLPKQPSVETALTLTELHRQGRAQRRLADYASFAVLDEGHLPAQHHVLICEAIDGLLNDEYDDLIINTPPGAAKSTYTSHALGAYFVGLRPRSNVIVASHTADLAERWSRKVRNTVSDKRHTTLFPDSSLSKDSTAVSRWATTQGGEFVATGAGAALLGFRADLAILDDVISGFEQAQSETQLAKLHGWYETDLVTRLKPGGKIVHICQRLSPNDLAGYMLRRHEENPTRRLRHLVLRMECEAGDPPDGTGRSAGQRLWPEWFTQMMVEDAKRDDYRWRTLYQQRPPSSSGDWVSREDIRIADITPDPSHLTTYVLTDLALSVNKGDYSVHLVVGVDHLGTIHVLDAYREQSAIEKTAAAHLELVAAYKPIECLIDDDNAAKVYMQLLYSLARTSSQPIHIRPLPMRGQDKETRNAPLRGLFRSRRIVFRRAPWNAWLIRELILFPNAMGSGVDDGVDALGLIGRRLIALGRPADPTPAVRKSPPTLMDMTLDGLYDERTRTTSLSRRRL